MLHVDFIAGGTGVVTVIKALSKSNNRVGAVGALAADRAAVKLSTWREVMEHPVFASNSEEQMLSARWSSLCDLRDQAMLVCIAAAGYHHCK